MMRSKHWRGGDGVFKLFLRECWSKLRCPSVTLGQPVEQGLGATPQWLSCTSQIPDNIGYVVQGSSIPCHDYGVRLGPNVISLWLTSWVWEANDID